MRRLLIAALVVALAAPASASAAQDLTQYVNPLAGTLGSGFPMVGASAPLGLMQLGPDTGLADGSEDPVNYCGYAYQDPTVRGFSLTHFDGAGIKIGSDLPFMPTTGTPSGDANANASPFEHATETATPGYYAVTLAESGTRVELTSASRAGMARFTFPKTAQANVIFDPTRSADGTKSGEIQPGADNRTVTGSTTSEVGYTVHFQAVFDRDFHATRAGSATALTFDASSDPTVTMRVAISYIDAAGAAGNLAADAPARLSFDRMRKQARADWNERLHRIEVEGGSAEGRRTFYSSLYRFFLMPSVFDDADGRYLGMDGQVRTVRPGTHHYTALSLWDTYRTQMPLLELIEPGAAHDVAISLLDDADANNGVIPRWVQANIDRQIMGGDSATAIVADAVQEGVLSDAESQRAFNAMWRQATTLPAVAGREGLAGFMDPEQGWVGQDESGRSGAALTLEYAIDDTALLGVARRFGTPEQVTALERRAANWQHLMNPDSRFLQPRNKDGSWPNPHPSGALGAPWRPEFQDGWQEGTGWQYLWFVPQDVPGLADRMGGRDVALDRLDQFFAAPAPVQDKTSFFGVYYIGNQFTPSNETDLWVPWFYDWLGQPWKTQREARQAMSVYSSRPDGMPGNDDTGTMSAFYVLAALGLYHAQPGVQAWQLNSPSFGRAVIDTGARDFTIEAPGASRLRKYVQSARLGKRSFDRAWLSSAQLRSGGRLAFELGARPNKDWASGPDAAPPALSAQDHP